MAESFTPEELELLEGLEDPDSPVSASDFYEWDEEVQREIVGLMLNDKYFVVQSMGLIKNQYFTNECHKIVVDIIYKHFEKYKVLPNKVQLTHQLKEVTAKKDPHIKVFYLGELNTVYEYYLPGIETREYYLDIITEFAKHVGFKNAMLKALKDLDSSKSPDWDKIESEVRASLAIDRNFDIGLDYFRSYEERYERMLKKRETGDYFVTAFDSINEALAGGGLARGEIGAAIGLPGTGKSIFLVNSALANLHRGKKVLYLSLEINDDKCAERFDAQFANPNPYGGGNTGITTKNLYERKDEVFESLQAYVSEKDDSKLMIIKQFPGGVMGLTELRAYYSQLGMSGFNPDLVVIDYVGEMKDYPGMPEWQSRQKIVRDLRSFAVEMNVCVLTAMQVDAKSREAVRLGGVIDDDNLADSKGQNRPLDALWSINQLNDERECNLARIFVIKHRDGKGRFNVHVEFDYGTLKMREISESKYKTIFSKHKNEKTVTVAQQMQKVDEMFSKKKKAAVSNFTGDAGYNGVEEPVTDPDIDPDLAAALAQQV